MLTDVLPMETQVGTDFTSGNGHIPWRFERRNDGRINAVNGKVNVPVTARLCFPWTFPNQFVSLRNSDEAEVLLIEKLDDVDKQSRKVLEQLLAETGFVLEIRKVLNIKEDFEIRSWSVITAQGPRQFQTRLDDWPHLLPSGGVLIRDVSSDLLLIKDPTSLDPESRKQIQAHIE